MSSCGLLPLLLVMVLSELDLRCLMLEAISFLRASSKVVPLFLFFDFLSISSVYISSLGLKNVTLFCFRLNFCLEACFFISTILN